MRNFKPDNKEIFKEYCKNENFYIKTDIYYNKADIKRIIRKNFRNCDYIDCLLYNDYSLIKAISEYRLNDDKRFCIFNLDNISTANDKLLEMIDMLKIYKKVFIHIVQFGDKNYRYNIKINRVIENFIENIFYKDTLSKSESKRFAREYIYILLNRIDGDNYFTDFFDTETNENIIKEVKKIKKKYEEYSNLEVSGKFIKRCFPNDEN